MALQNRVDPFGELIATPARGMFFGNRGGRFHRDDRTLGTRRWASRQWICCVLDFKNRQREVWGRYYTEMFFLDEATALAAGHRPCAECQRERYRLFREHWAAASGIAGVPSADGMDDVLHAERLEAGRGKRTYTARLAQLPAGVMVADEAHAYLVLDGALLPWAPEGYGPRRSASAAAEMRVLTPRSIVDVIARGYPVGLHASALV